MIGSLFCETALLPEGWRRNVLIELRGSLIDTVTPDAATPSADERAAIVLPGMPDVHSHAFQRAMAGLAERTGPDRTDDFWGWRELMYRFLARIDADDLESIAAYAYADMLEAGFTSVGEFHYLHRTPAGRLYADPAELALRHLAAADATGIGFALLPVFYEAGGFGGAPPTPGQRRFITNLDEFAGIVARLKAAIRGGESRTGRGIGVAPHSLRAVTPEALAGLLRLYPRERMHIHAAEQKKEVSDCVAWCGRRPVEWLLEHAGVDERWCIVHATHLASSEIAALAQSGAVAGLCPLTEANLGDGVFPAVEYASAGGRWAIGSDANICLDAAGELRQLEYSQRLFHGVRNALAAPERPSMPSTGRRLFEDASSGGARALGLSSGAIAPSQRADFVILDDSHPDLEGRSGDAILDTWIFAGGRTMIRSVVSGGERVVEHGRHRDRERLDAAYRRAVARLIA